MSHIALSPHSLPVVVQVGFAGSRHLVDKDAHPTVDVTDFLAKVQAYFTTRLKQLPTDLRLSPRHFLCGVSQAAIGADTIFTRACRELDVPQRIFLPQQRDEYLNAIGSDGEPDFPGASKQESLELIASSHVINERVVSDAAERRVRFEDTNLEIILVSDVAVCLVRAKSPGKPGGSRDFIQRAQLHRKPVLEISVDVENAQPSFREAWHLHPRPGVPSEPKHEFTPPSLPLLLAPVMLSPANVPNTLPSGPEYFTAIKSFASEVASRRSKLFKRAASIIIGTHVLATVFAVVALTLHGSDILPWLLAGELLLLAGGFGVHQYLHHSDVPQDWALARLVAELSRSVLAIGELHVYLEYLFNLPFPDSLRPLLRTINVLHLRSNAPLPGHAWKAKRDAYVANRLTKSNAQVEFYRRESANAEWQLSLARRAFVVCSVAAALATLAKLLTFLGCLPIEHDPLGAVFGALAVVLPVLAVAVLSLAAAFDLEARRHTFGEMLAFLERQARLLMAADSESEFAKLLLETESRLLGETANWFSRRSFTGVV